jgi:hypothetical protein
MHEGTPYGHLTINGAVPDMASVARLVGITSKTLTKRLSEVTANGIFLATKSGVLFSPRMVRDYEKALKRQADGGLGGNPAFKQVVNHEVNQEVKPQIPDTRYQKERNQDAASRQGKAEIVPINEAPKAKLFRVGKTLLVSLGISEKQSGSVIGRWLKQKNDPDGILAALQYAADHGIIEPIGYVTRCLSKDSRIEKPSLTDQARELADRARELEDNAGIGRPPASIGSV